MSDVRSAGVSGLDQPGRDHDATTLHVADSWQVLGRYARRAGEKLVFGYPLLRLTVLVECGTRAVLTAVFGPEADGETTQAQFLCRSGARRTPLILRELSDGSYLSVLGYGRLKVRIIEAWVTVTWADGTTTREQWRSVTSLLDHRRYPAAELVKLYHRRWQVETTYSSIKESILDGRVLRSQDPAGIEQEMYALLTVYQAIIRMAVDAIGTVPGARPDRVSFTAAVETAGEQVITAVGIIIPVGDGLVGAIGQAVLGNLLPGPRHRGKARTRHNPTSKYGPNAGTFPQTSLKYAITANVMIMEEGLTARSKR